MSKNHTITIQGHEIALTVHRHQSQLSLTDIARYRDEAEAHAVVQQWLSQRHTIEFLALWESLHNPQFLAQPLDGIRKSIGLNGFNLTPRRWVEATKALGMRIGSGKPAAVFAHRDIAFEFASWISPEFKLYLILELQRSQVPETSEDKDWQARRMLSKLNYRLLSESIQLCLVPGVGSAEEIRDTFSAEADLLNVAVFGHGAAEWRALNPDRTGNIRDNASLEQLTILANLECINAVLIQQGMDHATRLEILCQQARQQRKRLFLIQQETVTWA